MADISAFKANMKSGGARSNQFRCIITFPTGLVGNASLAGTKAEFLCKSASIPASDLTDIEVMFRGRPVHFAGERTFQPWQVSVYNDNDFILRDAFEGWVQGISAAEATTGVLLPSAYQVDAEVHQLDRNDVVVKKYKFFDIYPTNVGDIQLSWDQNNNIQEYAVQWSYNYWTKI